MATKVLPTITIPGLHNLRCVGGLPIVSRPGYVFRPNYLYRSAAPQHLTQDSIDALKALNLTTIYDMRSEGELKDFGADMPVLEAGGIDRRFVPVFRDEDWSTEALASRWTHYKAGDLVQAYRELLAAGAAPTGSFRSIFSHVLNTPEAPLLVHCTAGKDRTGVVVALALELAGVADNDIARDYALTTESLQPLRAKISARLRTHEIFKGMESGAVERGIQNMLSSDEGTMRRFLAMLRDEYGGAEEVVTKRCGFTPEEVRRICENLVVKA